MTKSPAGHNDVDDNLQRAIEALAIRDVHLRRGSASLADDFEPQYDDALDALAVSCKHFVRRYEILQVKSEPDAQSLFRVVVDLGTRWMRSQTDEEPDAEEPVALVEATMVADYLMHYDPGEPALDVFARRNASYHIWPYWREYLSLQCLRMNMPKITLPVMQVASNRES
jgi:hypothetical protein